MIDKFSGPFEVASGRPARGRVVAPPSKSHAIRTLICTAFADGWTLIPSGQLIGDDVEYTGGGLMQLGHYDWDFDVGGGPDCPLGADTDLNSYGGPFTFHSHLQNDIYLGGSATAFRFMCAVAALRPGTTTLNGDRTLQRRLMDTTVQAIEQLGVSVLATMRPSGAHAPITVSGGPPKNNRADVDASASSHPLSALLLIGPSIEGGLTVRAVGDIASRPYADLTVWTMRQFGIEVDLRDGVWRVPPGRYLGRRYHSIVGDWSSAAFLMGAAAVGGDVTIDGLEWDSPQADRRIEEYLRNFGATVDRVERGVRVCARDSRRLDVDLKDSPDLAPLVGALGCVAEGTTRVRGAAHLRIKESDRIAAVVAAARALGCEARELPDGFEIDGPAKHGGLIETRHDHRIAMAFAVAGLAIPGVVIDDPACVAKSYPAFWDDLLRLTSG